MNSVLETHPSQPSFWVLMGLCIAAIKIHEAEKAGKTDETGLKKETRVVDGNHAELARCLTRLCHFPSPHRISMPVLRHRHAGVRPCGHPCIPRI